MTEVAAPDWRWRWLVARACLRLALSRLLIAAVPLRYWRGPLGKPDSAQPAEGGADAETRRIADAVLRAAQRLPFATKCLPRAVALHTMLRSRGKPSKLVIAVLDPSLRGTAENLHAWVEASGEIVIGEIELPFQPFVYFG